MAGIGFELRKIFGRKTLVMNTFGILYSAFTTIGPSLVFIVLLFALRILMRHYNSSEMDMLFFTEAFTHIFLVASLISGSVTNIVSRYISDRIFVNEERDISATMFGVMVFVDAIAGVLSLAMAVCLYVIDHKSLVTVCSFYLLALLAVNAYVLIIFVSALKEYKQITFSYLFGVALAVVFFFVFYYGVSFTVVESMFSALAIGFFFIDIAMAYECLKAFGMPNKKYFTFLRGFQKFPALACSGIFYVVGLYASNVIYWYFSDLQVRAGIFSTAPNYDMAMFLAMLINLSGLMIFEIKAETSFFEKYVQYLSVLDKGTYDQIERERQNLQNNMSLQLFFVYEVQLIITILLICLIHIIYPYLGIGSSVLNMFLILGMAVYCIVCMYFTMIFLYYLEDHVGAMIGPAVCCAIIIAGSVICCFAGMPYYPIPVLVGGIAGWVITFLALRRRMRTLNEFLFCK